MNLPIKNEYAEGILELTRLATTMRVIASQVVCIKPCWLLSVVIEPTNAGAVSLTHLRNGNLLTSDILISLGSQYAHPTHNGPFPIYFNQGLFVEFNTNIESVTAQFLEDSP